MSQNVVTTRSISKKTSNDDTTTNNPTTPTTSSTNPSSPPLNSILDPLKNTPSDQKMTNQTSKCNTTSTPPVRLEYNFLEDLKNTKANILFFELVKIPQIQEKKFKILQGKSPTNSKEINVRTNKGTAKTNSLTNDTLPKIQVATNASLTRQRYR
jgi:hypothetical protein